MNDFLLLAAAAAEAESGNIVKDVAQQFGVNGPLLFSQIISFCIVAFLLHRFAYKPILKVLEERRQKIAEGLANAEQIKKDLANAQTKSEEIVKGAGQQATRIIEEARSAAARLTEQETQKAITAANEIVAKARAANESDLARLKGELKQEIGRLAVQAAMQVTGKILTEEDQRRLIEETNRQLAA
jgi:F-type H+-transporting ATPase subunit b